MNSSYLQKDNGNLIIENYNWAKPFSNCFPGIAGETGIPMWIYYVNRAQAVCSFGIHNKDHAIMPFLSFNTACQVVGQNGFRTFIRQNGKYHEPFKKTTETNIKQTISISASELALHETNQALSLEIDVCYFPLTNKPVSGLVRRLIITNRSKQRQSIEILDGISRILPYGISFEHYKVIRRHIEAMMGVSYLEGFPVFRLKQTPQDIEQIGKLAAGHYYINQIYFDNSQLHRTIVDPAVLFGDTETTDFPWRFMIEGLQYVLEQPQVTDSRTPCAFSALEASLGAGDKVCLDSVVGAFTQPHQLSAFLPQFKTPGYIETKRQENKDIIQRIKNTAFSVSSNRLFDQYTQHTFLENVMRGGMPLLFDGKQGQSVFYVYARQNGDLERDYHWFILEPTYLSQGNSHYRNMLQNRRIDSWFFPFVKDHNLRQFLNLIQMDGYNPLEITSVSYRIRDADQVFALFQEITHSNDQAEMWMSWLKQPFTPGEILMNLHQSGSNHFINWREILARLLPLCIQEEVGSLQEGYWIDHWTYNLDLLESVLSIHPDCIRELLIDDHGYTFFDSPDVVHPRNKKTYQVNGQVRQYNAVVRDKTKKKLIMARTKDKHKVRRKNGHGDVYQTNMLVKWLCIIANKLAALDPSLTGIEMEAGKPGWCDSLNGLPGLFGSSTCESLELIRACRLIRNCLVSINQPTEVIIHIYEELSCFMKGLEKLLEQDNSILLNNSFVFWDKTHSLREAYLEKTRYGIVGNQDDWSLLSIQRFLELSLSHLELFFEKENREKLFDSSGVPYTYFINPRIASPAEGTTILSKQKPLTPFLEGPVHYLRVYPEYAKEIYEAVKNSQLFDSSLRMYRCCQSLKNEPFEIGRIQAYPNGWLENASIYTHMEYKWLLEVLRSGLFEEFYQDLLTVLVPFQEPSRYGRSTIENCSFIVSSAFSDKSLHGRAYQPRLSGMTCEFLHIWMLMTTGPKPFSLDRKNRLQFTLKPSLPGWLFTKQKETRYFWDELRGWEEITFDENQFAFKFLNKVLVVYNNPKRLNTYGDHGSQVKHYKLHALSGEPVIYEGVSLPSDLARQIRSGNINQIDVELV